MAFVVPAFPILGAGVGAGGQGLSQTGRAIADADVAVPADGVGELDEPAVLLGDLEADQHPRRHHPRRLGEVLGHLLLLTVRCRVSPRGTA